MTSTATIADRNSRNKGVLMSCHYIGLGMNSVAEDVLAMYDEGELTREQARRLLRDLRKAVHWCDGNEAEATICMEGERCGRCLSVSKDLTDVREENLDLWKWSMTGLLCPGCLESGKQELGL